MFKINLTKFWQNLSKTAVFFKWKKKIIIKNLIFISCEKNSEGKKLFDMLNCVTSHTFWDMEFGIM